MPAPLVVVIEFTFMIVAYTLVATWYVMPALSRIPLRSALPPLLLVHLVRPVSLWLMVPDVIVRPSIPHAFAAGTASGDLLAAILALIAAVLVHGEKKGAIATCWLFNVVGLVDALRNCVIGIMTRAPLHMGAGVLIPAYAVPLLLVSHVMIFQLLLADRRRRAVHVAG
jgi:hypothetical protein